MMVSVCVCKMVLLKWHLSGTEFEYSFFIFEAFGKVNNENRIYEHVWYNVLAVIYYAVPYGFNVTEM